MVIRFHFFYFFLIRNVLKKLFSVRFRRRTSPVTTWLYDRRKMNEKKWEIIAAIRLNLQVPLDNFKKDKTKVSLTSPRVALSRLQRKAKREETKKTSSLRLSIFNVSIDKPWLFCYQCEGCSMREKWETRMTRAKKVHSGKVPRTTRIKRRKRVSGNNNCPSNRRRKKSKTKIFICFFLSKNIEPAERCHAPPSEYWVE